MRTKMSSNGHVVLPVPIRRKLGLHPGDPLQATVEGERIVLTRDAPPARTARMGIDALTGLPVLKAAAKAPKLTSREVAELLREFP